MDTPIATVPDNPVVSAPDNPIITTTDLPPSELVAVQELNDKHDEKIVQEERDKNYNEEEHNRLWTRISELENQLATLTTKSADTAIEDPEKPEKEIPAETDKVVSLEPVHVEEVDPAKSERRKRTFIF